MPIRLPFMIAASLAASLAAQTAFAHCDALDGPVARAAFRALETDNVHIAMPYAPAAAEPEIRAHFERARKVRALGADARALADRSFVETVVRLHRAGEGAPFEGLKPAGLDHGPAIEAADAVVRGADLSKLRSALAHDLDETLAKRLEHVRENQSVPAEARVAADVARVRERISAELAFIGFAESLRLTARGGGAETHAH